MTDKSLKIEPDLHRALAVYAAQIGKTMREVAESAIRLYIGPPCKLPRRAS
jgi:hypothetical protein